MPETAQRDLYTWAETVHNVWHALGNSEAAAAGEGIPVRSMPFPHYGSPVSLNETEAPLVLPELASEVTIGVELACRIGADADLGLSAAAAESLVDGYHVFVAVHDRSHYEYALRCSNFPHYGRADDRTKDYDYEVVQTWADGFSSVSRAARPAAQGFPAAADMELRVADLPPLRANTSSYVHRFGAVIEMIARFVRLQEGDIISLGRAGDVITLEPGRVLPPGTELTAAIDGVGCMTLRVEDRRSADNFYSRSLQGGAVGGFV